MRYRKLTPQTLTDPGGDMEFGHGQRDFWRDVPDAPAQAVWTRLRLWVGDWFLDTSDGTPYNTQVLGRFTERVRDPAIRSRILATPGVSSIDQYSSSELRDTRKLTLSADVTTIYGRMTISGPI